MNLPEEIRNKTFTRSMRGYNIDEVEDYIEMLLEKYDDLYRENAELRSRIDAGTAELDNSKKISGNADGIISDARAEGERIKAAAKADADRMLMSTKADCESVAERYRGRIEELKKEHDALAGEVNAFKARLFSEYSRHIKEIEAIAVPELKKTAEEPVIKTAKFNPFLQPLETDDEALARTIAYSAPGDGKDDTIEFLSEEEMKPITPAAAAKTTLFSDSMQIKHEPSGTADAGGRLSDVRLRLEKINKGKKDGDGNTGAFKRM